MCRLTSDVAHKEHNIDSRTLNDRPRGFLSIFLMACDW
jgi:hypothetical protein